MIDGQSAGLRMARALHTSGVMTTDKTNEIITTYVTDVHALVAHGVQAIHRQVDQLKNVSIRTQRLP